MLLTVALCKIKVNYGLRYYSQTFIFISFTYTLQIYAPTATGTKWRRHPKVRSDLPAAMRERPSPPPARDAATLVTRAAKLAPGAAKSLARPRDKTVKRTEEPTHQHACLAQNGTHPQNYERNGKRTNKDCGRFRPVQ